MSRLIVPLVIALAVFTPVYAGGETAKVFYYGSPDDGYLGQRHAAFWHDETPKNWPEVVDLVHHGIATSDWTIPFGTRICIKIIDIPLWAQEEYSHLIGRQAEGVAIDRMAPWIYEELGCALDLWPALFQQLVGPDWERLGTFTAKYWVCNDVQHRQYRHRQR